MSNLHDEGDPSDAVDAVDDPIVADAETEEPVGARKLPGALWMRVFGERVDPPCHTPLDFSEERHHFLGGGRENLDAVRHGLEAEGGPDLTPGDTPPVPGVCKC